MPRMPMLSTRDQLLPAARPAFDAIAESRGRVGGPFAVMLHAPEVAARAAHLGSYIRFESGLSKPVRELATLVAAHVWQCGYEWGAHERQALAAGVPEATIAIVANDGSVDALTAEEAVVVRFGRELLTAHRVEDPTFTAARAAFGDRGVVELTSTFGYYAMLACVLNMAEVEPA